MERCTDTGISFLLLSPPGISCSLSGLFVLHLLLLCRGQRRCRQTTASGPRRDMLLERREDAKERGRWRLHRGRQRVCR